MIWDALLLGALVLAGAFLGALLVDLRRAGRWLARKAMPASGAHSTGEQQRLPELPQDAEPVMRDDMLSDVRARQQLHADAMHELSARYLPAPPRPVNGLFLGTQPRRHPDLPPEFDDNPGTAVLRRVLAGLEAL